MLFIRLSEFQTWAVQVNAFRTVVAKLDWLKEVVCVRDKIMASSIEKGNSQFAIDVWSAS